MLFSPIYLMLQLTPTPQGYSLGFSTSQQEPVTAYMPLWNPQFTQGLLAPPSSELTISELVPGTTPSQYFTAVIERSVSIEDKIYKIIAQNFEYEKVTQSIGKSPLSQTIPDTVLPPKFHTPKFRGLNEGTDPHEHITQYE